MSSIYLKVTIEKKSPVQNFEFLILKSLSPGQFWGAPNHADIIEFSNFLLQLKNLGLGKVWEQNCAWIF